MIWIVPFVRSQGRYICIIRFSATSREFSSEIESSSGENEFSLLLSDGRTSERKESLRRHQLIGVQMEAEGLFAPNDHLQKSALILVVRVLLPAVAVISVDYEQVEAREVKTVVPVFFVEVREHLQQRTLLLPRT